VQQDLRKSYWQYVEDTVTPKDSDHSEYSGMKRFWTFVKHRRSDFSNISPLKVAGRLITDSKQKAEALNNQFQSVFTKETDFQFTSSARNQTYPSIPTITITSPGVEKLLKNLKPGKAAGPDCLSPRVLKELADIVADPLTCIFNKSLKECCVPSDWRHANVAPIFKKGQKYDPANYRPISLTCIASKLMEHIICSSMMKHASRNNIFYSLQHGFRDRRSCETQLIELVSDIASSMEKGLQSDVCVLDFSKAFDKVGHQRLVEKLKWYGITGEVNSWIASFLKNRTQSVVVEGVTSDKVSVISGVPQGSVLGPCLFLYYINDIAEQLASTTRLFADDTMIYMTVRNKDDAKVLQEDIDKLVEWESKWMMKFHPEKCEVITISRKKNPVIYNYTMHGHQLSHVSSIKYLGLTISDDLRWDKHVDKVVAKANSTLGFLRRNINIRNTAIKSHAYKALVRPLLEYSSSVWDPYTKHLTSKVEMVQRRAARFTLHKYRRTDSVTAMLKTLNWPTLELRRQQSRLAMLYKIHHDHVAIDPTLFLSSKNHTTQTRCENSLAYHIPFARAEYHQFSFFPRTTRQWNILPECIVNAPSPAAFKKAIHQLD
jgi:hypothetical protein